MHQLARIERGTVDWAFVEPADPGVLAHLVIRAHEPRGRDNRVAWKGLLDRADQLFLDVTQRAGGDGESVLGYPEFVREQYHVSFRCIPFVPDILEPFADDGVPVPDGPHHACEREDCCRHEADDQREIVSATVREHGPGQH